MILKYYNECSSIQKINLFELYQSKLSNYSELYTDIGEIILNIHNNENFNIIGIFDNHNNCIGYIQFIYFQEINTVFVDYICLNNIKNAYSIIENKLNEKYNNYSICTEFTFSNKRRNNALEKIFLKQGFYKYCNFIQPPTMGIIPSIGSLFIKNSTAKPNIIKLIEIIYFEHYGKWYRDKFYYNMLLNILFYIQCKLIKL